MRDVEFVAAILVAAFCAFAPIIAGMMMQGH